MIPTPDYGKLHDSVYEPAGELSDSCTFESLSREGAL
jgi:hypothetical protein